MIKETEKIWHKILNSRKILSGEDAKDLRQTSQEIRKESGFRILPKNVQKKKKTNEKNGDELSQKALLKLWDNPKDEAAWKKYLK